MPTTHVTDARGQMTALAQYTTAPTLTGSVTQGFTATGGARQSIAYEYTATGKQARLTGPDNTAWTYTYDLLGRQTSNTDPDTGTSLTAYDDAGNVTATRDPRGIQLGFTYDLLGRKLTAFDKSKSNFKYASWTYDTLRTGQPTSSSRYVSGVTGSYTVAVTGYTTLGHPQGQTVTLPTAEQPLPTTYTTTYAYTQNRELLAQQTDPAVAGMSGETIRYGHDILGAPQSTSGIDMYVAGTTYTDFGKPSRIVHGPSTNQAEEIYSYDDETLRTSGRRVYRSQGIGPLIDDTTYTYDEAGNPLTTTDKQAENGTTVTDVQCYQYDPLDRLADAWTTNASCAADPSATTVSNAAGSYWQTFHYDAVGDRINAVDHSTTGGVDVTTKYTNGCTANCDRTGGQPHTLTSTTGGTDPTQFVYDVAGNLLTRTPTTSPAQTIKWDDENHLAEVATSTTSTKYLYDADGNQLIRRDPGRTTLFAGDTQIVINTSTDPATNLGAVRTYAGLGAAAAVRSTLPGGGTSYLLNDPHGTSTLAMDTTTQAISRQQYKPYGEPRITANANPWPDSTLGYLGKPQDTATGYTDLGARKYDTTLGRFISPDPLLETTDPNQVGGYTYAGDNPVTRADPTGLRTDDQFYGPQGAQNMEHAPSGAGSNGSGNNGGNSDESGDDPDENHNKWTIRHNVARDEALHYMSVRYPFEFWKEYQIKGASKKRNGNPGYADIVAYDPVSQTYYIWEVKHIGGVNGEAGAEAKGPSDLQWYMQKFREEHPGSRIQPGPQINYYIMAPDPLDKRNTLITTSSTTEGRPSPEFNGVIIYWTRRRQDTDENTRESDAQNHAGQKSVEHAPDVDQPSFLDRILHSPFDVPLFPPIIPEPVGVPPIPVVVP